MTLAERKALRVRRWMMYQSRIKKIRDSYGMKWSRQQTNELVTRVNHSAYIEGVDDIDLRVMVRLFNREIIGKDREAHDS